MREEMETHVFHRDGYEPNTVLVQAESEIEARGKAQKELLSGCIPEYKGTVSDLTEENGVLPL